MSGLEQRLIWALLGIVIFFVLLTVLSMVNRKRLRKKHHLDPGERLQLEARLLEYVKNKTGDQKEPIWLGGFWSEEGKPRAQRDPARFGRRVPYTVRDEIVEKLMRSKHIAMPVLEVRNQTESKSQNQGFVDDVVEMIGEAASAAGGAALDIIKNGLALPPKTVRLTDRTFDRMNNGETGINIVQGHGGIISIGDKNKNKNKSKNPVNEDPFDPDALRRIASILRSEAPKASPQDRADVRRIAVELDEAADEEPRNEIAVVEAMTTAQKIIAATAAIFTASSAAIAAWFKLLSGGS